MEGAEGAQTCLAVFAGRMAHGWKMEPACPREVLDTPHHIRRLVGYAQTEQPQFELLHTPSGVGMREFDDFSPCRVAVWGTRHVISAEIFYSIDVQPGEVQSWTRRYEFFS